MNLSQARVSYGLNCRATPTSSSVSGSVQIGENSGSIALPNANVAYTVRAIFGGSAVFTLDTPTNTVSNATPWVAGAAQIAAISAIGTITAAGNVSVTITSVIMANSPKTIAVPVANGDTATVWAGKVRARLASDTDVSALFDVGGTGTDIYLICKPAAVFTVPGGTLNIISEANDDSLNIAIANGTSSGATNGNSADLVEGVVTDGVKVYDQQNDFEGEDIPWTAVQALLLRNTGSVDVVVDSLYGGEGASNRMCIVRAGGFAAFSSNGTNFLSFDTELVLSSEGPADISITAVGVID
jgi:hypothetical protein